MSSAIRDAADRCNDNLHLKTMLRFVQVTVSAPAQDDGSTSGEDIACPSQMRDIGAEGPNSLQNASPVQEKSECKVLSLGSEGPLMSRCNGGRGHW